MSEVLSFKEAQLRDFAKRFVDTFEASGKVEAALLARNELAGEHRKRAKELIKEEFFTRGYEVKGNE